MKNVLIGLDYDSAAKAVADVGFLLAKSMNAEVTLLPIISNPVLYYASCQAIAPLLKNADELKAAHQ